MASVLYPFPAPCKTELDGLILTRNAINKALPERLAEQRSLMVVMHGDSNHVFVEVDELSVQAALAFLGRLWGVGMLASISIAAASEQEWVSLMDYHGRVSST
jgi:hypothetical protein